MKLRKKILALLCIVMAVFTSAGCLTAFGADTFGAETFGAETSGPETGYICETIPLERNGIPLQLDCVKKENAAPAGQILLVHGSTYSSHEFDIDYQDYSLVRRLAGEGYAVWRIDIAGYGQSGPGEGFTKASQKISTHLLKVLTIRV